MRRHLITLISCLSIAGTSLYAQSSGGGGGSSGGSGGTSAGAAAGASGAATVRTPNAVHGPFSPVQPAPSAPQTGQNPNQTAPGTTPGAAVNAGVGVNGFATNSANMVPQLGSPTNQSGTALGGTNSMGGAGDFDNDNNRFGSSSNRFGGFTNSFRTNGLVFDQFTTPQDQALAHQIRQALLPEIRETRAPIHLIVNNGVVTLVGFVPSFEERGEIENQVQRTPGVVNVVDNLQIGRDYERGEHGEHGDLGTSRSGFQDQDRWDNDRDRDLISHARREMRLHNHFAGEDESVHIIARNGVVTLVGFVANTQEQQAFVNAVQNTPGVVQVINNIQIQGQTGANGNAAVGGTVGATGGPNGVTASGGLGPRRPGQLGGAGVNGFGIPNSRFGITTNLTPTSRENSPSRFFPGPTNSMNGTNTAPR